MVRQDKWGPHAPAVPCAPRPPLLPLRGPDAAALRVRACPRRDRHSRTRSAVPPSTSYENVNLDMGRPARLGSWGRDALYRVVLVPFWWALGIRVLDLCAIAPCVASEGFVLSIALAPLAGIGGCVKGRPSSGGLYLSTLAFCHRVPDVDVDVEERTTDRPGPGVPRGSSSARSGGPLAERILIMTSKFAPYVAGAAAVLALTAGTFATHAPAAQAFYWPPDPTPTPAPDPTPDPLFPPGPASDSVPRARRRLRGG